MKRHIAVGLNFAMSLGSLSALGAEPDDASRAGAREMGYAGVTAYEKGNFPSAVNKLSRAYDVLKVPTLGLWLARSLARSNKLVEAGERYLEVTRLHVAADDKVQRKAQLEAEGEYALLEPRIPSLLLELGDTRRDEVSVSIDGQPVPGVFLGETRKVNPGTHEIVVSRHGRKTTESISVSEGESKRIELNVPPGEGPAGARPDLAPAPSPSSRPAGVLGDAPTPARDAGSAPGLRTAGWVSLGAGVVGLGVGGVTGVLAMGKRNSLSCPDDSCTTDQRDEVDSYNFLRGVSSVGFIAGGVLAAAGGIILVLTPPRAKSQSAQLAPTLGLGRLGLRGTF